jgi:parvulin-like peptidyl-prolyl isomerase
MDAASPVFRWLFVLGLGAAAGCQSTGASSSNARGQAPPELTAPLSPASSPPPQQTTPLAQSPGGLPGSPVGSALPPVQGLPVRSEPVTQASLAAFAPTPPVLSSQRGATATTPEVVRDGTQQLNVVALVGTSNQIFDQEVQEQVRRRSPEYAGLTKPEQIAKEKEIYREVLRELIERELLLDDFFSKVKKSKGSIDDIKQDVGKMVDDQIRSIRKQSGMRTEEEFITSLHAVGMSMAGFRRQLERQMMADQYVRMLFKETGRTRNPGFAEIRSYYEQHQDEFQVQDRVRYQDVFIRLNNFARPEDAHAHAEQVRQLALSGTDFVSLIKAQEKAPPGRQNWDGIGTTRQDVPLDVAPAVWSLQPGQISDVIRTPTGFHIVKVVEREYAGVRPLDIRVQSTITNKLKKKYEDDERKRLMEDLWRNGTIQVFPNPMIAL